MLPKNWLLGPQSLDGSFHQRLATTMKETTSENTATESTATENLSAEDVSAESSSAGSTSAQGEVSGGGEVVPADSENGPRGDSTSRGEPVSEGTSTSQGTSTSKGTPTSRSRYPVLSRIPEVPGLLAKKAAEVASAVAETPETSLFFREREDGALEFYPWRFGPGYLFTGPRHQRRLRQSLRRFWGAAGLLIFVLEVALEGAFSLREGGLLAEIGEEFAIAGGLGVLAFVTYSIWIYNWVSGKPQAGKRGLFGELRRGAEMESTTSLWFRSAVALGFVLAGAALAWKGLTLTGTLLVGGAGILALKFCYQARHAGRVKDGPSERYPR